MSPNMSREEHEATIQALGAASAEPDEAWNEHDIRCALEPLRVEYDWQSLQPGQSRAWFVPKNGGFALLKDWTSGDYQFVLHVFEHGDKIQFETETFATEEKPYQATISFVQSGVVLKDHIKVLIAKPMIRVDVANLAKGP